MCFERRIVAALLPECPLTPQDMACEGARQISALAGATFSVACHPVSRLVLEAAQRCVQRQQSRANSLGRLHMPCSVQAGLAPMSFGPSMVAVIATHLSSRDVKLPQLIHDSSVHRSMLTDAHRTSTDAHRCSPSFHRSMLTDAHRTSIHANGLPPMLYGLPPMLYGLLSMLHGLPPMLTVLPPMLNGLPPMLTGLPSMPYGLPPMLTALPSMLYGLPPMLTALTPMLTGLPSMLTDAQRTSIHAHRTSTDAQQTSTDAHRTSIHAKRSALCAQAGAAQFHRCSTDFHRCSTDVTIQMHTTDVVKTHLMSPHSFDMAIASEDDAIWPDMLIERLTNLELRSDQIADTLQTIRAQMDRSLHAAASKLL